jgi:hypothetical protein
VRVLLFSMPDSFEHTAPVAICMPNAALASLAGNVDAHHEVAVADLVLAQGRVGETVDRLVRERQPDVIGLSVMTFQRRSAFRLVERCGRCVPRRRSSRAATTRAWRPARGRGRSPASTSWCPARARRRSRSCCARSKRPGVRHDRRAVVPDRERLPPQSGAADPFARRRHAAAAEPQGARARRLHAARQADRRRRDLRGCTFDCSFCSIIAMRGRNFHRRGFERVLADIKDARDHGARAIFIVDDNITLDVKRFGALCDAIVEAGLDDIEYVVQAMTSAIADHGEELAPKMRRAGFRYVFLGIENILAEDLGFLKADAKNRRHENGRTVGNATLQAIEHIHAHDMLVVGGLIVGNPGDTRESIEANLEFARRHVDWPYIQHPTPYPGTPMTKELLERGLILHERLEEYDGTTAVVRSEALTAEEIEFLRWRAERWMKLKLFPRALRENTLFCLKHGPEMISHTFRGSWRSLVGLESERQAFERYRSIRAAEREHL